MTVDDGNNGMGFDHAATRGNRGAASVLLANDSAMAGSRASSRLAGATLNADPLPAKPWRDSSSYWLGFGYMLLYAVGLGLAMNTAFPALGWGGNQLVAVSGGMAALLVWHVARQKFGMSTPALQAAVFAWICGVIVAGLVSGVVEQDGLLAILPVVDERLAHRLASYLAMTLSAILPIIWGQQAVELLRRRLALQLGVDQAKQKLAATELAMLTSATSPDELVSDLAKVDRALATGDSVDARHILDRLASTSRERLSRLSQALQPSAALLPASDNAPSVGRLQVLRKRFPVFTTLLAWEALIVAISAVEAFILQQPFQMIVAFVNIVGWSIALGATAASRWFGQPIDAARPMILGMVFGILAGKMLAGMLITGSPWFMFLSAEGRAVMPFSLFFTLTGAAIIWKYGERRRAQTAMAEAASRQQQAQSQLSDARLKALKAQIEPHFLFNTLSNIVAQTSVDPTKARRMTALLTRMLQRIDAGQARGSLGEELDAVRDFLELQGLRIGPRLSWNVGCPNELLDMAFPSLLLQPLVENSIRHGIETVAGNHRVDVQVTRNAAGGGIVVDVIDTGRGFASKVTHGVGLQNIRERLRSLFGDAGEIIFRPNSPTGLHVSVHIPLISGG